MGSAKGARSRPAPDPWDVAGWEQAYRTGELPWDSDTPGRELVRLVESGLVRPGRALDVGCGSGTNAVWLAREGFSVTGIDLSAEAIRLARAKAQAMEARVRFEVANLMDWKGAEASYDLVVDSGCFHSHAFAARRDLYARKIRDLLAPDGRFFLQCFSPKEPGDWGPRRVPLAEIERAFTPLFDLLEIRHRMWRAIDEREGPWSWACLMRPVAER
ncbi:MAG: class I SAM-dependent methyltransferase [Planctomycetes bacterium]|nr:class I SAM-dependent methyltransferase [Planctomycetota bacterium]